MPPDRPLAAAVVADLIAWVKAGAVWPGERPAATAVVPPRQHWAFMPLKQAPPPADPSGWSANAIDCFLRAKQRENGLTPAPSADRRTLLRRVTLNLTGLPPTPEEIESLPGRPFARCLAEGRRSPACLAALRRALGAALARRRPLRRHRRL